MHNRDSFTMGGKENCISESQENKKACVGDDVEGAEEAEDPMAR